MDKRKQTVTVKLPLELVQRFRDFYGELYYLSTDDRLIKMALGDLWVRLMVSRHQMEEAGHYPLPPNWKRMRMPK